MYLEARFVDQLFAFHGVGPLEPDDDRDVDFPDVLVGIHHPLRYPVATDDTPENVDQDRLDGRILQDDPESLLYTLGIGRTADVEEVGGITARKLDDVHRGHGKSSPFTIQPTFPFNLT